MHSWAREECRPEVHRSSNGHRTSRDQGREVDLVANDGAIGNLQRPETQTVTTKTPQRCSNDREAVARDRKGMLNGRVESAETGRKDSGEVEREREKRRGWREISRA